MRLTPAITATESQGEGEREERKGRTPSIF